MNDNSPVINTSSTFTTDENQVSVTNLSATDADGDNLNWSFMVELMMGFLHFLQMVV